MRPQLQWRQRLFPRLHVFHIPSWRIEGSETTVRGARARERVDAVVVLVAQDAVHKLVYAPVSTMRSCRS